MTSLEELYFSDTHANSGIMSIVAEKVTLRLTCKQVSETMHVTEVQSTTRRFFIHHSKVMIYTLEDSERQF